VGRGGSYRILGPDEPAVGFSLFPDGLIDALADQEGQRDVLFLPLGHDPRQAARLRAIGWRTVAALDADDRACELGCTHRLSGSDAVRL
jgi:ATP phosphoribosyltransferase regulatory subunit